MRVLLVDDEERFVSVLARRLRLRGMEADYACNWKDAFRVAWEGRFDVALLDIKMPGIGGIALRSELAAIAPGTRFIFMTGHGSQDDYEAGRAEGVPYLAKPIEIDELVAAIRAVAAGEKTAKGSCDEE